MPTITSNFQSGRLYCTPSPLIGSFPDSVQETAVATKGAVVNWEEDCLMQRTTYENS